MAEAQAQQRLRGEAIRDILVATGVRCGRIVNSTILAYTYDAIYIPASTIRKPRYGA
jgi:hypothetical protein